LVPSWPPLGRPDPRNIWFSKWKTNVLGRQEA